MDYEQKYKEALERAKKVHKYSSDLAEIKRMEEIFPELRESEDERIRKTLIENFKWFGGDFLETSKWGKDDDLLVTDIIAWLEKQGNPNKEYWRGYKDGKKAILDRYSELKTQDKQKPIIIIPKFRVGDEIITENEESLTITKIDEEGYWSNDLFICDFNDSDEWELVEQKHYGQREECLDCQFNYAGECKGSCVMKRSEQNHVDPKFHEGDWIVFNGLTLYIIEVVNYIKQSVKGFYRTITIDGIHNSYDWDIDNAARLWTIQDAKDGDVLKEDSCTFIIERMKPNGTAIVHCCLFDDGDFDLSSTLGFDVDSTHPATKEQRDLLFQKMHESGYEWDAKNKELNKIYIIDEGKAEIDHCFTKMMNGEKVSSTWSEEDENGLGDALWCCKQAASIAKDENDMGNVWYAEHWLKSIKQKIGG